MIKAFKVCLDAEKHFLCWDRFFSVDVEETQNFILKLVRIWKFKITIYKKFELLAKPFILNCEFKLKQYFFSL